MAKVVNTPRFVANDALSPISLRVSSAARTRRTAGRWLTPFRSNRQQAQTGPLTGLFNRRFPGQTTRAAERLRLKVENAEIATDKGPPLRWTASLGVASLS